MKNFINKIKPEDFLGYAFPLNESYSDKLFKLTVVASDRALIDGKPAISLLFLDKDNINHYASNQDFLVNTPMFNADNSDAKEFLKFAKANPRIALNDYNLGLLKDLNLGYMFCLNIFDPSMKINQNTYSFDFSISEPKTKDMKKTVIIDDLGLNQFNIYPDSWKSQNDIYVSGIQDFVRNVTFKSLKKSNPKLASEFIESIKSYNEEKISENNSITK